jgi:hypothetical protein
MATTTTNYGFDIPQSTDLVKDGATAIATLGQDIDTAMNTALGTKKAGMVLLNTTSFTAVTSQSINDVFSTTYDNYRIILRTTAIDAQIFFRLRVAGTDASGANYARGQILGASGGATFNYSSATAQTSAVFSGGAAVDHVMTTAEVISPFLAQQTLMTQDYWGDDEAMLLLGTRHSLATSYTGFTIFSTNNFTGTLSVYGYNK